MRMEDQVNVLKGVGEKMAESLRTMGVETVGDVLRCYPAGYEVLEEPVRISELEAGKTLTVCGRLVSEPSVRRTGSLVMTTVRLQDESGTVNLIWFRMPYLKNTLKRGEVRCARGRVVKNRFGLSIDQPALFDPTEYEEMSRELRGRYAVTGKLTSKLMRRLALQALDGLDLERDYLPEEIRSRYQLSEWNYAIRTIHFPRDREEMLFARKRLVFDEFLMFILAVRRMKAGAEEKVNPCELPLDTWCCQLLECLPYRLTGAQQRVWEEIRADLSSPRLMNRLIQGDVGSGKTVLAQLALLKVAENGYQGAIMAPTEVLARQHFESFSAMAEKMGIPVRCLLLTGSMTAAQKREAYRRIEAHECDLIIGTHALIQDKVHYARLALVVTDEQHRFGVHQRSTLAEKGTEPHIMVMSATPIPRTLAIILYGDMDISVVDELPANRLPIRNCVVDPSYRPRAYRFLEKQIREGRQVYVICPMVEEGENVEAENVMDYTEKLKAELPADISIEYLHGKMKAKEKNERMEAFLRGDIRVLVSTTVVEVGVNVPNATVMMIENAERFGLAQLHQLRGRVGRGEHQSYCIFVDHSGDAEKNQRLKILNETNDGFRIASEDLRLRGPGDVFGLRQSGDLEFALGDIFTDARILQDASEAAGELLEKDPELSSPETRALVEQMKRCQRENLYRMYL